MTAVCAGMFSRPLTALSDCCPETRVHSRFHFTLQTLTVCLQPFILCPSLACAAQLCTCVFIFIIYISVSPDPINIIDILAFLNGPHIICHLISSPLVSNTF